jgi:energy-converting hydrogenase Eha subunit G
MSPCELFLRLALAVFGALLIGFFTGYLVAQNRALILAERKRVAEARGEEEPKH